jgi:predicted acetyltransferase
MPTTRTPPHRAEPQLTYATEGDAESYLTAIVRGFHDDYVAEHWQQELKLMDWDRNFGFQVDGRWVATCGAFGRTMTVPGGAVPVSAVTIVTVAPPYRRRGLLTQMMKHQLERTAELGQEPVALLWASEAQIYGRFGYGHTTPRVSISGATRATAFLPSVQQSTGSVDEVGREEFHVAASGLRERLLAQRPGALDRSEAWWDSVLFDPEAWRRGATAMRFALHFDEAGDVDGYANFRLKNNDDASLGGKQVIVGELDGAGPGAYAALWRYLLDLDLVRSFVRSSAPADEPLRYLVADQRAVKTELVDGTYARLVDLPAALKARTYNREVDVTLAVDDQLLPDNHGTFRLQTDDTGSALVDRSSGSPDLSLSTRELGAAYLGGTSLHALHRAGLVTEHKAGAVAALADALSSPTAPFCPDFF